MRVKIKYIVLSMTIALFSGSVPAFADSARDLFYQLGYCYFNEKTVEQKEIACNGGVQIYFDWVDDKFNQKDCKGRDKRTGGTIVSFNESYDACKSESSHRFSVTNPGPAANTTYDEQLKSAYKVLRSIEGKENHKDDYVGLQFALSYIIHDLEGGPIERHGFGADGDILCTAFIDYRMRKYHWDLIRGVGTLLLGDMSEVEKKNLIVTMDDYVSGFEKLYQYCDSDSPKHKWSQSQNTNFLNIAKDMYVQTRKIRMMLARNVKPALIKQQKRETYFSQMNDDPKFKVGECKVQLMQ